LSKLLKKSPAQIANDVANQFPNSLTLLKTGQAYQITAAGPYVNITFTPSFVLNQL